MVLVSHCCMCMSSDETVAHLFFNCPCACRAWSRLFNMFQLTAHYDWDLVAFFKSLIERHMSSQAKELWLASITTLFWGLVDSAK